MIKVMHVVSDMNIGGAGKVVINLINATPKDKVQIKAVVPLGSKLKSAITGAEVIEVRGMADKTLSFTGILFLMKIFLRERPDIVHTHAGLSARIAARLTGVKVVFTRHWKGSSEVSAFSKHMNNFLCDMAFAVSKSSFDSLVGTGVKKEKIVLLHNGVEPLLRDDSRELIKGLGISGKIVVGAALRLEPVKNLNCLLDAAAMVLRKRDDIVFLIAGEGSLEADLKARAKELGINDAIKFLGFVSDIGKFMSALDIHVLCSFEEAFPTSILEAMSLSVPTVASSCGGTEEQIESGKNGVLVNVNDSGALADGILNLAADGELRKRLGQGAFSTYKKKFGAKHFALETLRAYKTLLDKNSKP